MTTTYNNQPEDQTLTLKRLSKKQILENVYIRISNSLAEFDLHGKKFENKLKKASKLIAKDILKASKKKSQ
jgi:hypothetical protein